MCVRVQPPQRRFVDAAAVRFAPRDRRMAAALASDEIRLATR
jgi:hypothetical protein